MESKSQNQKDSCGIALHNLSPAQNRQARKRVGRGNASGWGRTAGRGEKGQKARKSGSVPAWFEGGSVPLYRKVPKFGFTSQKQILGLNQYFTVSLNVLNSFDDGAVVDLEGLAAKGYKPSAKQRAGIKVLASGALTKKLTVKVNAATKSAIAAIEKAGGQVELVKAQ